jgi:ketosteroid isomerase-like protein
MVQAANALDERFAAAMSAGDVEATSACYWNSTELIGFFPGEMVARGHGEVRAGIDEMFAAMPGLKIELFESRNVPLGDAVAGCGLFRISLPGPDGEMIEIEGRYLDVKAERDGQWVYIMDHASVPLAPVADEM